MWTEHDVVTAMSSDCIIIAPKYLIQLDTTNRLAGNCHYL